MSKIYYHRYELIHFFMKRNALIAELIFSLFILLFLYAGLSRLSEFQDFKGEILNQPINSKLVSFIAWALPILELSIALSMVFLRYRLWGLRVGLALTFVFTIYIILIKFHYFKYEPCSCGGLISGLTWTQHLFFNIFFLSIGLALLFLPRIRNKQQ